ncbi:uncharacterized protein QC763_213630 [Podospora pseudopauciseta]|uniref:Ornithine decarboxylase antizyme n=2 Tax=Podospora TaxID=5144 RepID=A0ABR0HSG0_9PEZI|nr:hypothetical protein QC763_213630 [Podospora pseudopauciseta]KAK4680545.1 hypothetical protein QC764_213630 [Podospora pseudoanserina]
MARTFSVRPTSSPAATSSTRLSPPSRASTTALRGSQGPSGIPEVPSTGLPSPPSSPPLAAITTNNELALTPKARSHVSRKQSSGHDTSIGNHEFARRRGGATLRIREECERFFCETLRAMFLGERSEARQGSVLMGVFNNNSNTRNQYASQLTPPEDCPLNSYTMGPAGAGAGIPAWMEIWDYAGGCSFRAFLAENVAAGEEDGVESRTLFVFFDRDVVSRDLKKALVALIELADGPLGCSHMVIAIERCIQEEDAKPLTKGLQWAGFSLTTLDFWSSGYDVISSKWLFMGMEL